VLEVGVSEGEKGLITFVIALAVFIVFAIGHTRGKHAERDRFQRECIGRGFGFYSVEDNGNTIFQWK
jgi:hypothetical protein